MLNREKGAAPLYSQIVDILKEKIENGEFVSGDQFYTEKNLQEMFQVSRITVRQAINELENEGYLQCFRGVGTTVTYGKIDENLKNLVSFTEEMKLHGKEMTTSYCDMSLVKADRLVAAQLEIKPGEECYRLDRVRNVDNEPIVYTNTFLKKTREYPLEPQWYMKSLYQFLQKECNTKVVKGRDTLEAILANAEISEYLSVPEGSPIFKRARKTYEENGEILEYSLCYYPGARYKYSVEL
ncbi:MAG: GntR family transcriptional regulator [Oliverpabstia sp.]